MQGTDMTEHDVIPSVDDADLAPPAQPKSDATQAPANAAGDSESDRGDRLEQLMREKRAAETVAARSMAEAAALRERLQQPGRPQDYNAPEEYTRAVAEHAVREVGVDMLARQASQAQQIAAKASQDAWMEATADFRQKVPDFETVAHNPNHPVTPIMADAIRESDRGAEIAYYLGKNPAEAAQISALPPVSQATAIARLEQRVGAASVPVSRAPEPIGTLSGRSGSAGKPLEEMDFEDYRRARGF
jgi:hypothetical protein